MMTELKYPTMTEVKASLELTSKSAKQFSIEPTKENEEKFIESAYGTIDRLNSMIRFLRGER